MKLESRDDGNNFQLMEARICQLISSLRGLVRSNKELETALLDEPSDKDFIDAIAENREVIGNKMSSLLDIVRDMKRHHGIDYDVPEDIFQISVLSHHRSSQITTATTSAQPIPLAEQSNYSTAECPTGDNEGFYL
eukprot:CAMPEP_0197834942 /NCGR_PEP_ID=MMETSP1437-20131217/24175_1 /TAXON_ID=49252 ORGANISM="Eucampia antarctica, Strain CCMP1452" /NCGR_SAMPLE_ID=MMETSP1437 /ASSEMBLY_ACC=CAM_ASM_001096 /LENGTH=135 /DNA_ID=CAMNT_0043439997 /DNA_START=43 /DNA_END=450 /DNA_ORIENTATION=+